MKCPRTVNDGKDRCGWEGDREDVAAHVAESGHQACIVCGWLLRDDETQTCLRCIARVRLDLTEILDACAVLPVRIVESGYRMADLPGGAPLVMSGDGSMQSPQTPDGYTRPREVKPTVHVEHPEIPGEHHTHPAYLEERVPSDGREHVRDHWPKDPVSVLAALELHERDWRHEFGHGPATDLATVAGCAGYLQRWLTLAARTHPAFDEFADDMARLHWQVQHVVGLADDPMEGVKCLEGCGTYLTRDYRPVVHDVTENPHGLPREGLADEWWCRRCKRVYSAAEYWLAVRAELEKQQEAS